MHIVSRYIILFCAFFAVVGWASAAEDQFTTRVLIECEKGAPRLNSLVYHSDGKTYVAGSLGRVGWYNEAIDNYTWECLYTYDELYAGCSVGDTLVFRLLQTMANETSVWTLSGTSPTTSRITSVARGEQNWLITTIDGDVYSARALLNAPWQNVYHDKDIRLFGICSHDSNVVAVGSRGTIIVSTNYGADWKVGFAPIDTLSWKCVQWFPNNKWMVGGEGARLVMTGDFFETEPHVEVLFTPYKSYTYTNYHPDAINFIQTLNDGGAIVGGFDNMRAYTGASPVENEAVFSSHAPFTEWHSHRLTESSSLMLSAVNCVGVRQDGDTMRAFTSFKHKSSTVNGIYIGAFSANYLMRSSLHSASSVQNIDEPWYAYSGDNAAASVIDSLSVIVARNYSKVTLGGYQIPGPLLYRYTWNDNSFWVDSIYQLPHAVYSVSSILADQNDLFVGSWGSMFVSADRGMSWSEWTYFASRITRIEGNRDRLVVVSELPDAYVSGWDTNFLTVTTNQGTDWKILEADVCAECYAVFHSMSSETNSRINILYNEIDSTSGNTLNVGFVSANGELFSYPALPNEMGVNVPIRTALDRSGTLSIAGAMLDDNAQWQNVIMSFVDGQWTYHKQSFLNNGVIEDSGVRDIISFDKGSRLWGIVDGNKIAYFSSDSGVTWDRFKFTVSGLPDSVNGIVSTPSTQFVFGSSVFAALVSPKTPTSVAEAPQTISHSIGYTNRIPIITSCRPLLVQAYDIRGRVVAQQVITDESTSFDPLSMTHETGVLTFVVSCEQNIQFATFIFAP